MTLFLWRCICWPIGAVGLVFMVISLPLVAAFLWCEGAEKELDLRNYRNG